MSSLSPHERDVLRLRDELERERFLVDRERPLELRVLDDVFLLLLPEPRRRLPEEPEPARRDDEVRFFCSCD